MRPPQRHTTPPAAEAAERSKALRESLTAPDTSKIRVEEVQSPVEIVPEDDGLSADPRSEEIMRLVAANTPSHRAAWKKNSKAWQLFFARRDRRAGEVGPEPISEEGNYVLDDFDQLPRPRRPSGINDSDVTDDDGE